MLSASGRAALLVGLAAAAGGLLALLGAPAAGAQAVDFGACHDIGDNYLVVGDTCTLNRFTTGASDGWDSIVSTAVDDNGTPLDDTDDLDVITAEAVGTAVLNEDAGLGDAPVTIHVIAKPTIAIVFHDTDGIVAAPDPLGVTLSLRGFGDFAATDQARLEVFGIDRLLQFEVDGEWASDVVQSLPTDAYVSGAVVGDREQLWLTADGFYDPGDLFADTCDTDSDGMNDDPCPINMAMNPNGALAVNLYGLAVQTEGLAAGEYLIGVRVRSADFAMTTRARVGLAPGETYESTFTVGDAGVNLSNLALTLADGQSSTAAAGELIELQATATNSLGARANLPGDYRLNAVAVGGRIYQTTDVNPLVPTQLGGSSAELAAASTQETFFISSGSDTAAATVDVYLLAAGGGGALRSETLTLKFTGPPAQLSLQEAAHYGMNAADGPWLLTMGAVDANGDAATLDAAGVNGLAILDANGSAVSGAQALFRTDLNPNDSIAYTPGIIVAWPGADLTTNPPTFGTPPAAGAYTVTAALNGVTDSEVSGQIVISGATASIAVELAAEGSGIGSVVTMTATLTDAAGNAVSDRAVEIEADGSLTLVGSGLQTSEGSLTRMLVVTGDSIGTVTVSAEGGTVSGVGVFVPSQQPAAPAPAPELEPSPEGIDALSSTSGFASWRSPQQTTAAALFRDLTKRGAAAVHLWNGRFWVRYSEVNGRPIPGVHNFPVTFNDIIYISD